MTQRTQKRQNSTSSSLGLLLALEPRFMFDAAGAATGAEIAADQVAQQQVDQILPPQAPVEQHDSQVDTSDSHAILPASQEQPVTSLNERSQLLATITNATLPATTATREIVFIDTRVENYQSLLTGINPGAQLVLLDSSRDGIEQITEVLSQYQQIDAVHIISHGSEGQLTLGNSVLNSQTMQNIYKDDLAVIGNALSSNADILIYGCNFAAGSDGLLAVNQLAQLTGADVAASNDATGAAALGGDWNLEVQSGVIDGNLAFSAAALTAYDGLLDDPVPTVTLTGSSDVFIGNNFTFTATFDNTASTGVGYAPYIDLLFPVTGKDGAGAQADDGINFVSATYLGQAVTAYTVTFDPSGNAIHPLAKDNTGAFRVITGQPGDKLVVLELPFGSVTAAQPLIPVVITASLSNLADIAADASKNLTISARAGFRFGQDALDNPTADPSIQQVTAQTFNVHPTLVTMTQSFDGPEQDTATGPNYVRHLNNTVTPASGQTLTNFDVSQTLPNTIIVKAITPGSGGTVTSITLRDGSPAITDSGTIASTLAAGTFLQSYTVRYATLNAAKTTVVDFYVPLNDYANNPILDPATGNDQTISIAAAAGSGNWTPTDNRDTATTVAASANGGTATSFAAKSIAVQKSVAIQNDTGSTGTTPGDRLEYSLQVDVSDYFAFGRDSGGTGSWLVDDVLSDGQTWDNTFTPTLIYTDSTGSHTVTLVRGTDYFVGNAARDNTGAKAADGKTYLQFDLDQAITRLAGDLHGGSIPNGASQVFIKIRSTVDDSYTTTYAQSVLNEGDSITNNVTTDGTLLNGSLALTGQTEADTSSATSTIAANAVTTSIIGHNGTTVIPTALKPGDTVTVKLSYTVATGDYQNFSLSSFLPLPVLLTNDSDANGTPGDAWNANGTYSSTLPTVGQWMYGSAHTAGLINGSPLADGTANSLTFSFLDHSNTGNNAQTVEVIYTLKVSDQPFADQLFLTLLAEARQNDTVTNTAQATNALVNIQLAEPNVIIKAGVVKISNIGASISGTTGTWEAAGTGGSTAPFTGTVTTASAVDGNLSNFDGDDTIRLATAIQNTGGSAAFDVTTTIGAPPTGLSFVGGSLSAANLKVVLGSGTLLNQGTDYSVSGNTITFLDYAGTATLGVGRNGATAVTNGSNVIVITYDVTASTTVDAAQNFTTTATLTKYAGTDGGPDFIPIGADIVDTATQVVAAPTVTKVFQGGTITPDDSSSASTTGANVVIGESMIYDIKVTLPEGETQSLRLDDLVPARMRLDTTFGSAGYQLITTLAASGGSLTADFIGSVSVVGSLVATPSGTLGNDSVDGRLSFSATSTTTADNVIGNNTFVVRVRLITDNVIGNQATTMLDASAQLVYSDVDGINGGSSAVDRTVARTGAAPLITVSEPSLIIVKTVDTDVITAGVQSTPIDANDTVEYTITVSNPSGGANVNAYDLILGDNFPSQLSTITIQSALKGATDISSSFQVSGNTVQTLDGTTGNAAVNLDLAPGESIVLVVRGTVNITAPGVTSFDSNSVVRWSSIDSTDNLPASQDADERTGADGVGSALNNYATQDGAPVSVIPLAPSLTHVGGLTDTAAPSPTTAPETVAIGEIVRYRGVVRIPEGSITNFNIQANLPSGLSYINDGTTKIAFVANGSGIASSIGSLTSGGTLDIVGNATVSQAGNIPADLSNGPNAVLVAGQINTSNAQAPVFNLGTLTNSDNDSDGEYVVIEFNVRVDNITTNDTADSFNVNFTARTDSTVLDTSNVVVENIVEPKIINLSKTVTAFNPDIGSGNGRATLTLNFTNSGDGAANDVHLIDSITGGSNYSITGVTIGGTLYTVGTLPVGVTASITGGITVDFTQIAVGTAVSVVYTVEVPTSAAISSSNATVTYSGLPGSFTSFAGTTVGIDASSSGERNGSGTPALNNYQDTDGAGLGIISGTLWDDTNTTNSVIDSGETRLNGQTVTLVWAGADGNLTTAGDNLSFTTTTDSSGNYHFGALPAGNYRITGQNNGGTITVSGDSLNPRFDSDAGTLGQVDRIIAEGATATANIGYVQVNNAPVNTVPLGAQSMLEDGLSLPIGGISVADPDAGSSVITMQLTVVHGTLNLTLSGGATVSAGVINTATFTLSGTQTAINASLATLTYNPTANYHGSDTLTVLSNDRGNTGDADGDGIPNETVQDALTDSDTVAITVTPVNDAPAGTNKTVNIGEDTPYTFSAGDFGFSDLNDNPAPNTFQSLIITTLPNSAQGTLLLVSTPVTTGQNILVAQLGNLVFQPTLNVNGNGIGAFTFQVVDNGGTVNSGQDTDLSPNTFAFNIGTTNDAPVNNVPAAQTTLEDTPLIFSPANGNAITIVDVDSSSVTVTLAVTNGTLTLNGITGLTFSMGDGTADGTTTFSGSPADINAALNGLSFIPVADFNGGPFNLTITSDDSTTTVNDIVAITVTPVNDAPAGTDKTVNINEDAPYTFSAVDFGFSDSIDSPANNFLSVILTTLPPASQGILVFNGVPVVIGQNVLVTDLAALVFQPVHDINGNGIGAFTFRVVDNGGTANGGQNTDPSPNVFAFNIDAINDVPVNSVPVAQITNEDTPLIFSPGNGNAISVADVDSPALTVTLSVANGVLTLSGFTGLTFSAGDGTADGTMTFSGSPADINAALNGLSFIPVADFNGGPVNLTITTFDGALTDIDTVAITVAPVADAVNDVLITPQNTAISFNPILGTNGANVDNFEGNPQITAINGAPVTQGGSVAVANGSVSLGANNVLTFTPATGFHGAVPTFTYTVLSGGVTETANMDITVNSPPQAIDNSGSGRQGLPVSGDLLSNDTDPDNNPLTISSYTIEGVPGEFSPGIPVKIPGAGTLVIAADGHYSFTPLADFSGTVPVVNYTITDGQGGFSSAALILKVAAEDSVPPDNLWNAGRGFTDPIVIPKPPVADITIMPILPVISAVTDANDLNSMTAIGQRSTHPVLQTIQRIGNMQFFGDRLNGLPGKFVINRGNHTNGPIGQELDRIEHLYAYNDQIERATSGNSSSWETGGLRHSITMLSREAGNSNHDHLTVHTTRSGNMLYVEIEHTVAQTPSYDVKRFSARLADGRPLPDWLIFDANSGVLSGLPAAGGEIIKLRVGFELESGKFYSNYVEIETDTARIVEQKNTSSPIQAGADKFSHQIAQSAGHFDAEVTRLRNTLGR